MHFTFTYIPHAIEKLQEYLDFLFFEVWLQAEGDFDADKLAGHPELQQIYLDLGSTEGKWAQFFNASIESIYREFLVLDDDYKDYLRQRYINNNNIEGLCKDKALEPITYHEIAIDHPNLEEALKSFYSKLYGSTSPFNLEVFGFLNSDLISEYDKQFMTANDLGACPFCGLIHLKGNNHSYREAYDHFIPKGLYPFNTLNFTNLTPMCHECNSTYKLRKTPIYKIDPLKNNTARSLAFYPYDNQHPQLEFRVEIKSSKIGDLDPKDVDVIITAADGFEEEIETWKRVFGLEERYKATLCSPKDGKAWFNSVYEEFENAKVLAGITNPETYYHIVLTDAEKSPLSGNGFLKSKFLQECKKKGLFNLD